MRRLDVRLPEDMLNDVKCAAIVDQRSLASMLRYLISYALIDWYEHHDMPVPAQRYRRAG